jgi:hypothetical protein
MSGGNNKNMDHYKTRSRRRQEEDVVHEMHKKALSATQIGLSQNAASSIRSGNRLSR